MSSVYGIWKHEMASGDMSVITTQIIREDGSYETHMIFRSGAGCEQHVHHYGEAVLGETTLKLALAAGRTEMKGCDDPSKNFELRDLTGTEMEEARGLLAREIPYVVESDTLTTTVEGPTGQMEAAYKRQGSNC